MYDCDSDYDKDDCGQKLSAVVISCNQQPIKQLAGTAVSNANK